jgi:hypothetical protein
LESRWRAVEELRQARPHQLLVLLLAPRRFKGRRLFGEEAAAAAASVSSALCAAESLHGRLRLRLRLRLLLLRAALRALLRAALRVPAAQAGQALHDHLRREPLESR